jgi:hypothetical protein
MFFTELNHRSLKFITGSTELRIEISINNFPRVPRDPSGFVTFIKYIGLSLHPALILKCFHPHILQ